MTFGNFSLMTLWRRCLDRVRRRGTEKQLRLREILQLGERRFLAVVEFEQTRFLVAGTASSITLLSSLPSAAPSAMPALPVEFAARITM